jgi:hypothetical protein
VLRIGYKSIFLLTLCMVIFTGCGRGAQPAPAAAGSGPTTGGGTIAGKVVLSGNPPPKQNIANSPNIPDQSLVCDSSGGNQNVIVFLANAPATPPPASQPSAVLDQINCMYVPHVLAVQAGEPMIVKSSDNLMHNVQFQCAQNPPSNFGFPGPGSRQITLAVAEPPFRVKCDVHPWMTAWIGVFNHPYFAVTGADGSFSIPHIPAGTYTLAAWQEVLPQQEQSVTVTEAGTTNVQFTFQLP